jgi:transposase
MAGVYKIEISESEAELKELLRKEKTGSGKERIQVLYLLKTKKAKTVTEAAEMLGRNRVTVQDWLGKYRQGGLEKLLSKKVSTGRPRKVPQWAEKTLEKRLKEKEVFDNYGEICEWLKEKLGIEAKYKTVHKLVYYRLKASPKIARPKSLEQSEERLEDFKKNLLENLAMLSWVAITMMSNTGKIRFLCEDETRLGLKTISGRKITAKGVKPYGKVQWKFQATYIYGVVEPKTGEHFFYEFTHLNSQCFQIFLELVSEYFADSILIIQLDNGRFHKAKNLKIPDNIILMFQPPHCPESNPIEQIWQYLKKGLRWKLPRDLEELRLLIGQRLEEMNKEVIASIVGRGYILDALSVVGI